MPTNNFKAFAADGSANVTSQTDYEALNALKTGFTAGKASSAQINKALRQSSIISSMLAQFIADNSGADVLDDGAIVTIQNNLKVALQKSLSLGTASQRDVGQSINTNQIPDMTSFTRSLGNSGYHKLPGGCILQWATPVASGSATTGAVTFPLAFPNVCIFAIAGDAVNGGGIGTLNLAWDISNTTKTQLAWSASVSGASIGAFVYFAIGY